MGDDIVNRQQARLDGGEEENDDDPGFVKALISIHEKFLDSFVETVNKNVGQFTIAEIMSTFCDIILKTGGEKLSESEVEESLDQILPLSLYLTDKDMFAEIYRNQLAK
jgi:cullin 1